MISRICLVAITGVLLSCSSLCFAQQYGTKSAISSFSVSAPAKTIEGTSRETSIHLNLKTGQLNLALPVASFSFSNNFVSDSINDVLKKRFNGYYLESNIYPNITYEGEIINIRQIENAQDGSYPIYTKGVLNMHGVTRKVAAEGTCIVKKRTVSVQAQLIVVPSDYGVRIPPYIGPLYFKQVTVNVAGNLTK